jgi:hypothetical protein
VRIAYGGEERYRLDFHENFRRAQCGDLDQGGGRKIAVEKFLPRAPDLGVVFDIDDVNRDLDNVLRRSAGGFDKVLDLGENDFRLLVLPLAFDGLAIARARDLPGNEQKLTRANRVRPASGRGFDNIGTVNACFGHVGPAFLRKSTRWLPGYCD